MIMYERYQHHLTVRAQNLTLRKLSHFTVCNLNFCSNDYLSLSRHPDIKRAIQDASTLGMGERGSRLLLNNQTPYETLELLVANSLRMDKALVFGTGYQLNCSVIAALLNLAVLKSKPLVFCDRLVHASVHAGCRLAGVSEIRYRHNDLNHLENLLNAHLNSSQPKFIITESLFGMDGDKAQLAELIYLKEKHHAFLFVDEAHALGVYGEYGYGLADHSSLRGKIDLISGSLSKGLGCFGGVLGCSQVVFDYLINQCGGFIYSNALPTPTVLAALAAWQLIPTLTVNRQDLQTLSCFARNKLIEIGCDVGTSESHLIPIIFKNVARTLHIQQALLKHGVMVSAIRPPTVAHNMSRLRLSLTSAHQQADITKLVYLLEQTMLTSSILINSDLARKVRT